MPREQMFYLKCSDFPLQDRKQPDVCERFFHDVPFEAHFASDIPELQSMTAMPGVDGFTMKVDALYKVRGTSCSSSLQFLSLVPFIFPQAFMSFHQSKILLLP